MCFSIAYLESLQSLFTLTDIHNIFFKNGFKTRQDFDLLDPKSMQYLNINMKQRLKLQQILTQLKEDYDKNNDNNNNIKQDTTNPNKQETETKDKSDAKNDNSLDDIYQREIHSDSNENDDIIFDFENNPINSWETEMDERMFFNLHSVLESIPGFAFVSKLVYICESAFLNRSNLLDSIPGSGFI